METNKPGPKPDQTFPFLGGEEAIKRMKIPPGFKMTLFASEEQFPDLVNPVQMAFDTRGRLWVAVWPNYPERTPQSTKGDSLLVLEDTNGDGRADKATPFISDLNCPTGFQFYKDGVLARNFAATTQEDMISGMQDGRIATVYFPYGRTTLFNDPKTSRFAGSFKTMLPPVSP